MPVIHADQSLTPNGWERDLQIVIDADGRIASVGQAAGQADHHVALILPAPVNLHSHAFQRAMAGLTETRGPDPRDTFWSWRRLMYRFLDQLTPDQMQDIAALVFMEMLEAGYAGVAEFHYLHHGIGGTPYADPAEMSARIVGAARDTGIGLTLLPVLYTQGGCDGRPLAGGQQRFGNDVDSFLRLHDGAARHLAGGPADHRIGVAPHSLRAVDPAALAQVVSLPGPVHMHLAEQVAEVDEVQAHLGARPGDWLLGNHDVDDRWCLIHCTQLTGGEITALARSGAVAGLCPITESNLGDGIFPATDFLEQGGRIGAGSDSNLHIALFDELKTLEYSQRLRDLSRAALAQKGRSTGRVMFEAVAAGGAQAAGRQAGAIAPGHWADLVALDTDNRFLCNRAGDALLDSLVFGGGGAQCVRDVWSAGRHVVRDGRHVAHDRIAGAFMATMSKLDTAL